MVYKQSGNEKLRLSFTFGGLLIPESAALAAAFLESGSWEDVRKRVESENLLQKGRNNTWSRYFREIRDRFAAASPWELQNVASGEIDWVRPLLLILFCRYYDIARQMGLELLAWKYRGRDGMLQRYEVDAFWNKKAEVHPEMRAVSDSSRQKLIQVLLRAYTESGHLVKPAGGKPGELQIVRPFLPEDILDHYKKENGEGGREVSRLFFR
jgi:hypothetical protein